MMGLVAVSAGSVQATEVRGDDDAAVYVVNNHLTDVRVYAEDANGRLHNLGRVARGQLRNLDVPEGISGQYRIKVFPAGPGSTAADDYGIKTNPLDAETDQEVRIWLEADLSQTIVEIQRG